MAPLDDYRNETWQQLLPHVVEPCQLAICDPVYEDPDLSWVAAVADRLAPGATLYAFADVSGVAQLKLELDRELEFMNWLVWPNDWGGRSRRRFAQKHDDILAYTKPGAAHTFNADAVAIPKKMTMPVFNPSGRTTKIPTSVWGDLAGFSTVAKERVRIDGKCVRWQKPERIIERLVLASSNPGELVLDPFSGVATVPVVCRRLGRRFIASEPDVRVHAAGTARLLAQAPPSA